MGIIFIASVIIFWRVRETEFKIENAQRNNELNELLDKFFEARFEERRTDLSQSLDLFKSDTVQLVIQILRDRYKRVDIIRSSGIVAVYKDLDQAQIKEKISSSKDIRILKTWISNAHTFLSAFTDVSLNDTYSIKITLLSPESQFAKQRSCDLDHVDVNYAPNLIRDCADSITAIKNRRSIHNLELRYYDALPLVPVYICDNRAYFGLLSHGKLADDAPCIEIEMKDSEGKLTYFGAFFEEQFEIFWNKPNPEQDSSDKTQTSV